MSNAPRSTPREHFATGALVVACALIVMALLIYSHVPPTPGRQTGSAMPPIKATGWINGSEPTADELAGKILVIDAWASWCGPCLAQAPDMVYLYEKYHDQGVEFIGLTNQSEDDLPDMEAFIKRAGIKWKNGYGADETLNALGAEFIPMVWVVDRQRQIVWSHASSVPLEEGIKQALVSK